MEIVVICFSAIIVVITGIFVYTVRKFSGLIAELKEQTREGVPLVDPSLEESLKEYNQTIMEGNRRVKEQLAMFGYDLDEPEEKPVQEN